MFAPSKAYAAPPAAGLEAQRRLPGEPTYNLHILKACASGNGRERAPVRVRQPSLRAIITRLPLYPEHNCLLLGPPALPAESCRTHTFRLLGYIPAAGVLTALLLVSPLTAQTVAEVQITPETMTLGVGQKQALFATAFDSRGNLIPIIIRF